MKSFARRLTAWALSCLLLLSWAIAGRVEASSDGISYRVPPITRAEFIRTLDVALGVPPAEEAARSYVDVPPGSPFFGYVETATAFGFANGVGAGRFLPGAPLTRAEAAKIEVEAYGAAWAARRSAPPPFRDAKRIPPWAVGYVAEAVDLGLLHGYPDGTFRPNAALTAADEASLVRQLEAALAQAPLDVGLGTAVVAGTRQEVLTAADGRTLYAPVDRTLARGSPAAIAPAWQPLILPSGVLRAPYDLGGVFALRQTAGGPQVTYNGYPLYTYAGDSSPGQANGALLPGWRVATPTLGVPDALRTVLLGRWTIDVRGAEETVLTDAAGQTLYYLDSDTATAVRCTGACAEVWLPFTAPFGSFVQGVGTPGTFSLLPGPNGYQVCYNGHPLYTFIGDLKAGEAEGDGFQGIWHAATTELPPAAGAALLPLKTARLNIDGTPETVLTDAAGLPLYADAQDSALHPACVGACLRLWQPLTAQLGTVVSAPLSVDGVFSLVQRGDGLQVAYDGHLLYTYRKDVPGVARGQGLDGVWSVVRP